MVNEERVQQLLEEMIERERTPEEVCAGELTLLEEVRARWQRIQQLGLEIEELFPSEDYTLANAKPVERTVQGPHWRPYLAARAWSLNADSPRNIPILPAAIGRELRNSPNEFWSLTEQGALEYRARRYENSLKLFEKSLAAQSKPGAAFLNWFWLAMAHHQLRHPAEAQKWLDKAEAWLNCLIGQMPADANSKGLHLHNWLEAHILSQEARKLIRVGRDSYGLADSASNLR